MSFDKPTNIETRIIKARQELLEYRFNDLPTIYNHSLLAQLGLPHRNPGNDVRTWERTSGRMALRLEAGSAITAEGGWRPIGMPYGAKARLVLLALTSAAVKTNSNTVELPETLTHFTRQLGLPTCGKSLRMMREQMARISVVNMRLAFNSGCFVDQYNGPVFEHIEIDLPKSANQRPVFLNTITFTPRFYSSLKEHAVPLKKTAICALAHSSRGIDLYSFLASRLYRVPRQHTKIPWKLVQEQFGRKDQQFRSFKAAFKTALKQVLYVYPDAKVEMYHGGIMLKQSKPPVSFREYERNKNLFS